ncbi:unnamed protein product [Mytilus edulis]|uniref:Uncharacterized protein n=1 Tax=Mytilus edulis TaxID=6550 RepID=A0A8S3UXZ8_MYTED|nr:unnamed protein product [Mytilus edulis]
MSESFDEDIAWIDFRQEVDSLAINGSWTSKAADLCHLLPILDITPTLHHETKGDPITLAYISSDNTTISEHYDACTKIRKKNVFIPKISEPELEDGQKQQEGLALPDENIMRGNETNGDKNDSQDTEKEYDSFYQSPKDDSFEEPSNTPHKPKKKGRPKGTPPRKAPNFITPPKNLSIDDEHRQQIFKTFWSLDTNDRKKDFIIANTTQKKTRTYLDDNNEPVQKKKNVHRSYSLNVDGNHVKICKKFFLTTLGISETFASNALQNQQDGVFIGEDKRGKHMPHNKTTKTAMELVRRHIESFPVVDGHYTRKDSNRKYLGADLNIKRMYELYIVQCKDQIPEKDIVSQAVYRKIFNEEYNFSFHVPKKDQCAVCTIYHQRNNERTLTNDTKKAYDKHQERKIKAREEKKKIKSQQRVHLNLLWANLICKQYCRHHAA